MLVATHYESVDKIETQIQDYVNEQLNTQVEIVLPDEYSLDDSRLELSPSVKTVVCNSSDASLEENESLLSDCVMSEIKQCILDLLPLELRQEFTYESRITDSDRVLLLRKNLTIVSLIQEIQDEIEGKSDVEEDTDEIENIDDNEEDTLVDNSVELDLPTEIEDVSLIDMGSSDTEEFDMTVSDADEFSLDDMDEDETVDDTDIDGLDEYVPDEENDVTEEVNVEEESDTVDEFTLDDTEEETEIVEDTVVDEIEPVKDENREQEHNSDNNAQLSELEIFKSIITDNTQPIKTPVVSKPHIDENADVGLEDLESVSEDEIGETTELDDNFGDDTNASEEQFTEEELDDLVDDDEEDEEDEEDEDDFDDLDDEDTNIVEEDHEPDEDDIEFEEESEDLDVISEIDKDGDGVPDTYAVDKDGDGTPDLFIDKSDDNVEFLDTSNVSMSKPNITTPKVVPKSELGRILKDKANSDKGVHEKRTFLQEFDKDAEQVSDKGQSVQDFKDRMNRADAQPVARAPAEQSVSKQTNEQPTELPPLRTYLKIHPYTLIEDLINMGYSSAEIQDGVKRGKFVKKNGMLRALY